jgi:mRNA-degrading endonuclease RelE of RelBE toxin-antitoxin system
MQFRIAETFSESLARLTGEEQKLAKTAAFDLQLNPAHPSLQFHKLTKARDKNFSSIRASSDLRIIVHRNDQSFMLCYVGHHDAAYRWAEQRVMEVHPKTGAAQLVELHETVREIIVPVYVQAKQTLFAAISTDDLLGYGVPTEWLPDVQQLTDEDSLLKLVDHLPREAAEALLDLATGVRPKSRPPVPVTDPFNHPDAQRRFRVMSNLEELERALEFPWEKWTIFLHPAQRQLIERDYNGPARVAGSAGTGKTIVALHRAVHLARANPDARVLLTTFSQTLANALDSRMRILIHNEPRLGERIEVHSLDAIAKHLYNLHFPPAQVADPQTIAALLPNPFHRAEWEHVVDAWQLETWESYRDVARLGRKTRLSETQRANLWQIFSQVRSTLVEKNLLTTSTMFTRLAHLFSPFHPANASRDRKGAVSPFDFIVVDEAQDVGVAQLRFLASMAANRPNALFFAGDLGQRIFQQPFSWKALGVDVRGRSTTLKINYRTSHQIRMQADRLLGPEVTDVDGNSESRKGTISLFNGPKPTIRITKNKAEESQAVAEFLRAAPGDIGIFVRSESEIPRATAAAQQAGLQFIVLDENMRLDPTRVTICTMHLAKGLEFRAVVVMACDDEVIPLQSRIETATDQSDLEEIYATERHLLYVACTRARDQLLVTGVHPASEFLADLGS